MAIHHQLGATDQQYLRRQTPEAMISIAIDPVALITTECITVTSAMRKHSRWAQSSVSSILGGAPISNGREVIRASRTSDRNLGPPPLPNNTARTLNGLSGEGDTLAGRWGFRGKRGKSMQDSPLMSAFTRLRHDLRGCKGQSLRDLIFGAS